MWMFLLMVMGSGYSTGHPCPPPRSNAMKVSLRSGRNVTGHWNGQVELKHSAPNNEYGPWTVDLEHVVEKYQGHSDVHILANISGPLQSVPVPRKKPGPDYEFIPALGYYKFHTEFKTWFEARDTCEKEGAHLVVINSQREANALLHFWVPHPKFFNDWRNNWAFVGFHDQYVEGEYVTIFGDLLNSTGYAKWGSGKPNTGPALNCGVADRSSSLLADVACSDKLTFFCEQELDGILQQ